MCIIIAKNSGVKLPSKKVLKSCFNSNPDGTGIMFSHGGKVNIEKGFMEFKSFWKYHQDMKFDEAIVYHFRIATAGGTSPENCHPFPISDSEELLKKLTIEGEKIAIAHNGIIPINTPKHLSDTQVFIRDILAGVKTELVNKNKAVLKLIEGATAGSRLALLYGNGEIITSGSGWIPDRNGLIFSNHSYLPRTVWYDSPIFYKPIPTAKVGIGGKNDIAECALHCDFCGGILENWGQDYYCIACDEILNLDPDPDPWP
jgi:predicted secreted protein